MRAWLRDTACWASTTWQDFSRPRVMTESSRTSSVPLAPASLRCVTVRRTLIEGVVPAGTGGASERRVAQILLARLILGGELFRRRVLQEVLAGDFSVLVLVGVLEELEETVVTGGELRLQLHALLVGGLLLGQQALLAELAGQHEERRGRVLRLLRVLDLLEGRVREDRLALRQGQVVDAVGRLGVELGAVGEGLARVREAAQLHQRVAVVMPRVGVVRVQ